MKFESSQRSHICTFMPLRESRYDAGSTAGVKSLSDARPLSAAHRTRTAVWFRTLSSSWWLDRPLSETPSIRRLYFLTTHFTRIQYFHYPDYLAIKSHQENISSSLPQWPTSADKVTHRQAKYKCQLRPVHSSWPKEIVWPLLGNVQHLTRRDVIRVGQRRFVRCKNLHIERSIAVKMSGNSA